MARGTQEQFSKQELLALLGRFRSDPRMFDQVLVETFHLEAEAMKAQLGSLMKYPAAEGAGATGAKRASPAEQGACF